MKHVHYRIRKIKALKPLTEGEPWCSKCKRHLESCQCLEAVECFDVGCLNYPPTLHDDCARCDDWENCPLCNP